MKKILFCALAAVLAAVLFVGCNNEPAGPVDTTDPSDVTTEAPVTTEKEKETKAPETEPPVTGPIAPNEDFDVIISDPIIIYQAKEGIQGWGRHQFPSIGYTSDGLIRVVWHDGEDKVGAENVLYRRTSMNGGKTWLPGTTLDNSYTRIPMPNGKYMTGFATKPTKTYTMQGYTPVVENEDGTKLYLLEDLMDDPAMQELVYFGINEYDPATDKITTVPATLEWPFATVQREPDGYIMPLSAKVSQHVRFLMSTEDGTLYSVFYATALDSTASTLEEAKDSRTDVISTFLISSADSGRTWKVIKQFQPTDADEAMSVDMEGYTSTYEGFDEPAFMQLASGRFIMLMRTRMCGTMVYSFSEDAVNWSDPQPFDICGCLPQLLTLDCGVTVATYGRPILRVRATSDPTGENWQDPITIELTGDTSKDDGIQGRTRSCFYTGIIQLDANTAMMVHSDFKYPNKNGVGVRTIMARRIHIVPKTAAAEAAE